MHHDTKGGEICTNNLYMTDTVSSSLVFYRLQYHTFPIRVSNHTRGCKYTDTLESLINEQALNNKVLPDSFFIKSL